MERIIDKDLALELCDYNEEVFKEITEIFLENLPKSVKILNDAFKSGDANLLNRAAHKIKGSVGNLAAIEAYEKAV